MSAEEDKKFDAVLGGYVSQKLRERAQGLHCPPPEILAAYHERTLLPEEMNSWKEHIAGCGNCQTILAHLEETDAVSLQAFKEEEVVAKSLAGSFAATGIRPAPAVPAIAGHAEKIPAATAARPQTGRRPLFGGTGWRWLVPAGAIAAGLLVWIAARENLARLPQASKEVEIAKNIPASTPSVPAQPTLVAPQSSGAMAKARQEPNSAVSGYSRAESRGLEQNMKHLPAPVEKAVPESAYADKVTRGRKDEARESSNALRDAESQPGLDNKTVGGAVKESSNVQAQLAAPASSGAPSLSQAEVQNQAANNQIQNQANANLQKIPGPAPLGQATEPKRARVATGARAVAAPAPPPPPPAAPTGTDAAMSYQSSDGTAFKKVSGGRLILVRGSTVVWRPGPGGLIEISNDKGASWSRQSSGVLTDLLAGSAVSDQICWLVGRAGTVLLTVDGGAHWKILPSPLAEDLGGIRATDALHATVWNVLRTKSFETTDEGVTWRPVPAPPSR